MSYWAEALFGYGGGIIEENWPLARQEQEAIRVLAFLAMHVPRSFCSRLLQDRSLEGKEAYLERD
ncbi:MAG: hypothetical protein HN742_40635 [Lentisphaerae bacterium]|jgi:hypothetical protein|nr:hypothetical protein [Lentisphaerota bacterium]MBT4818730.1 hypothetical protein [Lentisphaerota bacterium]MBT5606312.1 hypothetical protein [Lentisphaerota bacterium]MBT7055646.1 hypothetical protein [Lentisphaerota bacterium]MBT7848243.1 hypothetical protein [Lentisphaerota bacterium]